MGGVRSVGRWVPSKWGTRYWRPGRILSINRSGAYGSVHLYRDGRYMDRSVHVLVLEAFAGPRPAGCVALHGPLGADVNWWPENLSWGTQADNVKRDRERDGTALRGERIFGAVLSPEAVAECRCRYAAGEPMMALAVEYGVHRSTIYRAITGRRWRHL